MIPAFNEFALLRIHHHRHGVHLTREGAAAIIIITAVCAVILYFYARVKKNEMIKALGLDSEKDYKEFKLSCPVNNKNKFCMSDQWVVNEYSFKVYRTDDIIDVSPFYGTQAAERGQGSLYTCGILIRYRGGTDKFTVSSKSERDHLLGNIGNFLTCRRNGTVFDPKY